jgi:hypothetical protein
MGVAFRELRVGAPGGDYFSRAIVDCQGAPIVDTAFMGLTSWRLITMVSTVTRGRRGAQSTSSSVMGTNLNLAVAFRKMLELPDFRNLVALAWRQHTELMAVGIDHDHPVNVALPNVSSRRSKGDQTLDLRLLITVNRWREVEMQPILPCFWR